jgi:hypothetical protein
VADGTGAVSGRQHPDKRAPTLGARASDTSARGSGGRRVCVRLYRALHHDPKAAPHQPGGLLCVPPQGNGRIDNPEAYRVFYVGDTRAGVSAEVFNWGKYRRQWSADMLRPPPFLPVSHRAIAWYDVNDETLICNLDDPRELLAQSLRSSTVITRNYAESQKWALRLFQQVKWRGLRWWS